MRFRTSLAIGGTGMLASATRWLISQSHTTYVCARHASAFSSRGAAVAIDADWSKGDFAQRVSEVLAASEPIDCALLWLHEPSPILAWLAGYLGSARVVLVLGSMSGQPEVPELASRMVTVRLGSKAVPTGRRWLTDDEICAGAIAALDDGQSRVIGELLPV